MGNQGTGPMPTVPTEAMPGLVAIREDAIYRAYRRSLLQAEHLFDALEREGGDDRMSEAATCVDQAIGWLRAAIDLYVAEAPHRSVPALDRAMRRARHARIGTVREGRNHGHEWRERSAPAA